MLKGILVFEVIDLAFDIVFIHTFNMRICLIRLLLILFPVANLIATLKKYFLFICLVYIS